MAIKLPSVEWPRITAHSDHSISASSSPHRPRGAGAPDPHHAINHLVTWGADERFERAQRRSLGPRGTDSGGNQMRGIWLLSLVLLLVGCAARPIHLRVPLLTGEVYRAGRTDHEQQHQAQQPY